VGRHADGRLRRQLCPCGLPRRERRADQPGCERTGRSRLLVVFQTPAALSNFKSGNFTFGAGVNAIALDKGVAKATEFTDGVAIFTRPNQGLMAEASLNGQKFRYVPLGEAGDTAPAAATEADVASSREEPTTRAAD
jgi:hypothetical protein